MTVYTPTYRVTIAEVVQTADIVSGSTITFGRNDFFEPTQPSYCNLELLNIDSTSPTINLLDPIVIEVTDSSSTYVKLFTGEVSSIYNTIEAAGAGSNSKVNILKLQAQGALGLLVKRVAGSVAYPEELDGARITRILEETLYTAWEDLDNETTWNDLPAADTWETYGVQGIETIDVGRYKILARDADNVAAYNLTDDTATSGLGYIYDTPDGKIGYADAERRTNGYDLNGIPIDANLLSSSGFSTRLQTTDILNSIVLQYGSPTAEVEATLNSSVADYGLLQAVQSTSLALEADATDQATRIVTLRGTPRVSLNSVEINLSNDGISDTTRDLLLGVDMDSLITLTSIPVGIFPTAYFDGFVEGGTWTLNRKSLDLELSISNSVYSTISTQWEDYNPVTMWQNLDSITTWLDVA